MKTMTTGIIIGIVAGILLGWLICYLAMPKLMFKETESSLGFETTVGRIQEEIDALGWKTPAIHDLQATMKKFDHDVAGVKVFEICHPDHSYQILKENDERIVSSMMPCRISVYEKTDGTVWISRMNSGIVAKAFNRLIRKTMSAAAADVEIIIKKAMEE